MTENLSPYLRTQCHSCHDWIYYSDSFIIVIESKHFGVVGNTKIRVCKSCKREHEVNKII